MHWNASLVTRSCDEQRFWHISFRNTASIVMQVFLGMKINIQTFQNLIREVGKGASTKHFWGADILCAAFREIVHTATVESISAVCCILLYCRCHLFLMKVQFSCREGCRMSALARTVHARVHVKDGNSSTERRFNQQKRSLGHFPWDSIEYN